MIGDILQPTHLLLILAVALIVLGPKRLPEVGRSLGRGLRDFRNAMSGDDHEPQRESLHEEAVAPPQPTAPAQPAPQAQSEASAQPVPAQPAPAELLDEPQPVSTGVQSGPTERSE